MTEQVRCAEDVLSNTGSIARRLSGYESRPEQLAMANAVEEAIRKQHHLVAEAGTGVGKSFAYLVPAILAAQQWNADRKRQGSSADKDEPKRHRIVVSTHTISLQEQLITHDIPFLQAVLPVEFSAVLVKGRGNYFSLRRLEKAVQRAGQNLLFEDDGRRELALISQWAKTTTDGSRSDLSFRPKPDVWDEVVSDHGDCLGKKCPTHAECFYYKARRRVWNADLLIVNHALFFSDLALRREGGALLPDYQTVIFDEAHTIESVAADHLGLSVSEGQVDYMLNKLYNDHTQRGILVAHQLKAAQQLVQEIRTRSRNYFLGIDDWSMRFCRPNGRLDRPVDLTNDVSPALRELGVVIRAAAEVAMKDTDAIELTAAAARCDAMSEGLRCWAEQKADDSVFWVERSGTWKQRLKLMSAPVEIADILREHLFEKTPTVIMASATLSVGAKDFRFFRSRVGLVGGADIRMGSPFDFKKQVRLILSSRMPDPASQTAEFEREAIRRMKTHLLETGGRAFVLFTSYSMLKNCASQMADWFRTNEITLYCQGGELQRSAMLDQFKADERAVLFGTDSFWQGVNVPGEALQNVIIPRLPFSVPDHPLLESRVEKIRERGGNPFRDYQVPEAVIKLKQGFGRLIRHRNDTGRVVILDPRVLTKQYGRLFVESLPDCRLELDNGNSIEPLERY